MSTGTYYGTNPFKDSTPNWLLAAEWAIIRLPFVCGGA